MLIASPAVAGNDKSLSAKCESNWLSIRTSARLTAMQSMETNMLRTHRLDRFPNHPRGKICADGTRRVPCNFPDGACLRISTGVDCVRLGIEGETRPSSLISPDAAYTPHPCPSPTSVAKLQVCSFRVSSEYLQCYAVHFQVSADYSSRIVAT